MSLVQALPPNTRMEPARTWRVAPRGSFADVRRSPAASAFESAVLTWIAARSGDGALQQQLATAQIAERDHTGGGCCSRLRIESDA